MHRIQCPSCQNWLKLPREVRNAKLKCSKCGHIFVGSSQDESAPAKPAGGGNRPDSPTSDDPAAALAAAAMAADKPAPKPASKPASAPAKPAAPAPTAPQTQAPPPAAPAPVKIIVVRRKKSNLAAFVSAALALLLIPVVIFLIYNVTHKKITLVTPDNVVVFQGWVSNDDAVRMQDEHLKKYNPALVPTKSPEAGGGTTDPKTPASGPRGTVSDGGLVGVASVKGDKNFTVESVNVIPNEAGGGGVYVGVVRSKYDTVVESVDLRLKVGPVTMSPTTLTWIAPKGVVPFTIAYTSDAKQTEQAPEAIFSEPKIAKDYAGWDVPAGEPRDNVENGDIIIKGAVTNTTEQKIVSAKLYADFATDKGVAQATVDNGDLKLRELAPDAKSDYTVTWRPTLVGLPHKFYLRVIGQVAK